MLTKVAFIWPKIVKTIYFKTIYIKFLQIKGQFY